MRGTNPINAYQTNLNKNKRNVLAVKQKDINSSIPKQAIILNQAHTQTHTRQHRHTRTHVFKICRAKRFFESSMRYHKKLCILKNDTEHLLSKEKIIKIRYI